MGSMIKSYRQREKLWQAQNIRNRSIVSGMVSEQNGSSSRIELGRQIRARLLEVSSELEFHVPNRIQLVGWDSYKTLKSRDQGVTVTGISYLAPATRGPLKGSLCPWATLGCFLTCLDHAGKNGLPDAFNCRRWKTWAMGNLPGLYGKLLFHELGHLLRFGEKLGMPASYRSDGTTDMGLGCLISQAVNDGQLGDLEGLYFYDYTADPRRVQRYPRTGCQVTFSFKGHNFQAVRAWNDHRQAGDVRYGGIAVPYDIKRTDPLPEVDTLGGQRLRVIDGDQHDGRPWDDVEPDEPHIVGLHYKVPIMRPEQRAKGEAIARTQGFIRPSPLELVGCL